MAFGFLMEYKYALSSIIQHCGVHKLICEDTALIGDNVINDCQGDIILDTPAWISLFDGVGGNAGRRDASVVRGKMNLPSRGKDFFHCTVSRIFSAQ